MSGCNGCMKMGIYKNSIHFCFNTIIDTKEVGPDPFFDNIHGIAVVYNVIEGSILERPSWCPYNSKNESKL